MVIDSVTELFLSQFFMLRATLGNFGEHGKELFSSLGQTFFMNENEADRIYNMIRSSEISAISTEKDYYRHLRAKQYLGMISTSYVYDELTDALINIKGNAIINAASHGIKYASEATATSIYQYITGKALLGDIFFMRILGIMQREGIICAKDRARGLKTLEAAASWYDIPSILLALYYGNTTEINLNRLCLSIDNSPYGLLLSLCERKYGYISGSETYEHKMLVRAFGMGILKREIFSSAYAKIIYHKTLSLTEKENLVFSYSKEQIMAISGLPLELCHFDMVPLTYGDSDNFDRISFFREKEQSTVIQSFVNSDLRIYEGYRPVCISSSSQYMLRIYADAIKGASDVVHIERFEASDLNEYDFEPNERNILVKNCRADKLNVYFFFLLGKIKESVMCQIKNFLITAKRSKFRLSNPAIVLNLGEILPVCFCDRENAKLLEGYCESIVLSDVSSSETRSAVLSFISEKSRLYKTGDISITESAMDKIVNLGLDKAENTIDAAIRRNRKINEKIVLTEEMLSEFCNMTKEPCGFGFGGANNGRK
ncbi:MAG: hypothetical protein MR471_04095 [Clostridia bacterium]|nr:hypothetical protein [Clostridia bacterium]MDY3785143.1 hypothetical protein [Eubacteriales bacterium]